MPAQSFRENEAEDESTTQVPQAPRPERSDRAARQAAHDRIHEQREQESDHGDRHVETAEAVRPAFTGNEHASPCRCAVLRPSSPAGACHKVRA